MIAWNIFILKLATPYPPTRFVSPSFPLLTLTYLILLYPLRNYLVILFSSLFLFCTCYPIFINPTSVSPVSVSNIHKGSVGFRKYPQDTIDKLVAEGIFEPAPQRSTGYILSPKYPVIVLGTTYFYPYYYFVYLGNKGTIRFTEKLPTSDFPYKKFFIIRYSIFNDAQQEIWDSYNYKIPLTSQEVITSQIYFVSLD